MESFTFSYTVELEDWTDFNKYHTRHHPRAKRTRLLLRIVMPIIFLVNAMMIWQSQRWGSVIFLLFMAVIWFFGISWFFDFSMRRRIKKMVAGGKNVWMGTHEMTISPEKFSIKSLAGEGNHKWKAVEKIGVTDNHVFIYVTPVSAMIIPKRSFTGERSFEDLKQMMQEYFQTSEQNSGSLWN